MICPARVPLAGWRHYDARAVKLHHLVAGASVGLVVPVLVVPGCESILGLDGYRGAAEELCDLYEQCYGTGTFGACLEHVRAQLEDAPGEEVTTWLTAFGSEDCLASCGAARECLDLDPICGDASFGCSVDEQCCGFTTGLGACFEQQCCKDDGAECADDAECCGQVCTTPPNGSVETCGGIECADVGEACENDPDCCTEVCSEESGTCAPACLDELGAACQLDIECCSRLCRDGQCTCAEAGAPCQSGANCCGGFCGEDGTCKEDCKLSGAPCEGGGECCSADCLAGECCGGVGDSCESDAGCCGQNCLLGECACSRRGEGCIEKDDCCPLAGECEDGVCTCADANEPCESIGDCCTGVCSDGSCQCALKGDPCEGDGDCCSDECESGACSCRTFGEDCSDDANCCSSRCGGGECCAMPASCDDATASDACVAQEAPLSPNCFATTVRACIFTVCSDHPECCCTAWDQSCVQAYKMTNCANAAGGACNADPVG